MRIWVIATGEPVPFLPDECNDRFLRAGKLAQFLGEQGNDTTWWTTRFYHQKKSWRDVEANSPISFGENAPKIVFLDSPGYNKNISIQRFYDHWQLGTAFREAARNLEKPDLIFCAYPIIELAFQVTKFGKKHNIPVCLDIRDLWPDVIYERLSSSTGLPISNWLLPYEWMAKSAFQTSTSVIALSDGMLAWGQNRFSRPNTLRDSDAVFHQFKAPRDPSQPDQGNQDYWMQKGVDLNNNKIRFVWVGSIVKNTDGPTLLRALKMLPDIVTNRIEVVVCGVGDFVDEIIEAEKTVKSLNYVGWVNEQQLAELLKQSDVGLLCYLDRKDFQMSIPNKVVDYCEAGMRILTNLSGEIRRLQNSDEFVIHYQSGDASDLARVITELAEKPNLDRTPSVAAKSAFDDNFDAHKTMPNLELFFKNIINKNPTMTFSKNERRSQTKCQK